MRSTAACRWRSRRAATPSPCRRRARAARAPRKLRPHARHRLVRRGGIDDLRRGQPEDLAVAAALTDRLRRWWHFDAVIPKCGHGGIGEPRHVVQRQRLAGARLAIVKGNAAFLAPLIGMRAAGTLATDNPDTVHDVYYSLAPLPCLLLLKNAMPSPAASPPRRPPPTPQSSDSYCPPHYDPWDLLGLGLGVAFQQIRPELASRRAGAPRPWPFAACPSVPSLMLLAPYRNSL